MHIFLHKYIRPRRIRFHRWGLDKRERERERGGGRERERESGRGRKTGNG